MTSGRICLFKQIGDRNDLLFVRDYLSLRDSGSSGWYVKNKQAEDATAIAKSVATVARTAYSFLMK
jgi:hypothetical protein